MHISRATTHAYTNTRTHTRIRTHTCACTRVCTQVHSSDHPMHWNMTKDVCIAFAIAAVGVVGTVILVPMVRPTLWFLWPELNTSYENVGTSSTSGKVRLHIPLYGADACMCV